MSKCRIDTTAKVRLYEVIQRAVSEGIEYGYRRSHKHTDKPSSELITGEIYSSVMNNLSEIIDFD